MATLEEDGPEPLAICRDVLDARVRDAGVPKVDPVEVLALGEFLNAYVRDT